MRHGFNRAKGVLPARARNISVRRAQHHNLRDISPELPREELILFTGLSGSGKRTLAFDTIYAEG